METISREFTVSVYPHRFVLTFSDSSMPQKIFEFARINSLIVNAKSTIEFSYESVIYRMRLARGGSSVRYLEQYQHYQNTRVEESS